MSAPNDEPAVTYDLDTQIVTVSGFRFTRDFFSAFDKHREAIRKAISKAETVAILQEST